MRSTIRISILHRLSDARYFAARKTFRMFAPATATFAVFLALSAFEGARALPNGAPARACARIFPEGHSTAPSQPLAASPYTLDITALDGGYVPGETYMLTLSGTENFRGLLVQARTLADDTPVGSFEAVDGVTRLSSCERSESAITHSSRSDKTIAILPFTAPPAGTGPFRFLYAVVQVFSFGGSNIFYATLNTTEVEEAVVEPELIELAFTGDTPRVTGNDISVLIFVSRPVPLLCQLITRGTRPQMPIFTAEENCTSGAVTFLNVEGGEHRVRVIAGDQEAVIRSRVILMPDSPTFCSLNAINRGVSHQLDSNGVVTNCTIEWNPIGFDAGFFCAVGDGTPERCTSPFTFPAREGVRRVKVFPDPIKCPGRRRPLVFLLN